MRATGPSVFIIPAALTVILPVLTGLTAASSAELKGLTTLQKREFLLDMFRQNPAQAVPVLERALSQESALVRRTAAHLLVRVGKSALTGIGRALKNPDFQVRRIAIDGLVQLDLIPRYWGVILQDDHPSIRRDVQLFLLGKYPLPEGKAFDKIIAQLAMGYEGADVRRRKHVVEMVASLKPLTGRGKRLLVTATGDEETTIRERAFGAIYEHIDRSWKDWRRILAIAEGDDSERVRQIGLQMLWKLLQVAEFRLPSRGWRFKTDPENVGSEQGWFTVDLDDETWQRDVRIETSWQEFFEQTYFGAAWYRLTFELPEWPAWNAAYLDFGGVDESAKVWVNGICAGEHDMGLSGWNVPFQLDITALITPGEKNQVTVRATNTRGGGGIWKPVLLRAINR